MNEKYLSLSLATLLAGALLQPVYAGEAKSEFKALDTDDSGAISAEEAQANDALAAKWEAVDANGDGQVDEAEFAVMEVQKTE